MADSIRERLANLAAPLGITLPEEYVAFMEDPPERGLLVRHLCNEDDDPYEWWPEAIEGLEDDWGEEDEVGRKIPFAHYVRATADNYLADEAEDLPGPNQTSFRLDRLRNGFWIGEIDGDSVFIDQQTLGIFAFLQHEDCVEQWASSFEEFLTRGQQ